MERLDQPDPRPVSEQIIDLGRAIARCAVEHRAALQMSFFEGPSSDPELAALTGRRPEKIQAAMLQLLRAGRWSGYIRPDVDLPTLSDRLCQSLLHVGLDIIRHKASTDAVATLKCRITLEGLAAKRLTDSALNRSSALAAADAVIATWVDEVDETDKAAQVRAAARAEFGRRGYEMTTIRDIASAAGLGTGTVYRLIGSKDELLMSIMVSFGRKVGGASVDIIRSDSTVVENSGRPQLAEHQRTRSVPRRVPDPAGLAATLAADTPNPVLVRDEGPPDEISAFRRDSSRRDLDRESDGGDAGPLRHRRTVDSREHPSRTRHEAVVVADP